MQSLCNSYDADALIVLATFDSDSRSYVGDPVSRTRKVKGVKVKTLHYPAHMDITIEFSRNFMLDIVCPSDETMQGDINADGILNIQDIILMVNIVLGFDEYNEDADISGDGIVNILDVIQLMNSILDL